MTLHLDVPENGGFLQPHPLWAEFVTTIEDEAFVSATIDYPGEPAVYECQGLKVDWPETWEAVYAFALRPEYADCRDRGRVLKVGLTHRSGRIVDDHFDQSVRSGLAAAVLANRVLWPYLGINHFAAGYGPGDWIREHCYVAIWFLENVDHRKAESDPLMLLERYLRGRLGPVFEGTGGTPDDFGVTLLDDLKGN